MQKMGLKIRRRAGQGIVVDGDIVVRVVSVRRRSVRLLITAPLSVPIVRGELLERGATCDPLYRRQATNSHAFGRLAFSRRRGMRFAVGGDCWFTVERITPSRVDFVIDAPRERKCWRAEISNHTTRGNHVTDDKTGEESNDVCV